MKNHRRCRKQYMKVLTSREIYSATLILNEIKRKRLKELGIKLLRKKWCKAPGQVRSVGQEGAERFPVSLVYHIKLCYVGWVPIH